MRILTMARFLALAGSSILLFSACASAGEPDSMSKDEFVGTWVTGETYPSPSEPFLTIAEDGTWTGSDGCNGVDGTWSLDPGGMLTTEAGPSTLMHCDGAALPTFLANAKRVVIADGTLTLFGADGKSLIELMPGTPPAPTGATDDVLLFVGHWGQTNAAEADSDRKPYLELSEDGTVSGTDGCNRLMGSWTVDGSLVSFERLASTRMACEGVDTWLAAAASATLEGDTLMVFDAGGKLIGSLVRS